MMIVRMMNKQLKNTSCFDRSKLQQQNLEELMRLTLINILNAKGVIYTYYKQQQEREQCNLKKTKHGI
jgi:hypothetical protein